MDTSPYEIELSDVPGCYTLCREAIAEGREVHVYDGPVQVRTFTTLKALSCFVDQVDPSTKQNATVDVDALPGDPYGTSLCYPTPGGGTYHARTIGASADVPTMVGLMAGTTGAFLIGPPGSGKTTLIQIAADQADRDLTVITCQSGHEPSSVIGGWVPDGTGYKLVLGELGQAVADGDVVLLDDVGRWSEPMISAVYSLLDGKRTLDTGDGRTLDVHDDTIVFATGNPEDTDMLPPAFHSRFPVTIEMGSDPSVVAGLVNDPKMAALVEAISAADPEISHRTVQSAVDLWDTGNESLACGVLLAGSDLGDGTYPQNVQDAVAVLREHGIEAITSMKVGTTAFVTD